MLRKVLALVVRIEAVFLRVVHDEVTGKVKIPFFVIDLDLLLRKRSFPAVSGTLVVSAKHHGVTSVHT